MSVLLICFLFCFFGLFFPLVILSVRKKKDDRHLPNDCNKQKGRACFHVRKTSSFLLLHAPSLSPPSPSVCRRESPNFCSKQQVEPRGVHEFLINEFKDELFTLYFLYVFYFIPASFPAVCVVCYS